MHAKKTLNPAMPVCWVLHAKHAMRAVCCRVLGLGSPHSVFKAAHARCWLALARFAGAAGLQELQDHPFFSGVDWTDVRAAPAPRLVQRPLGGGDKTADGDEGGLDWELTSLVRDAAEAAVARDGGGGADARGDAAAGGVRGGVRYEYLPPGTQV